MKLCVPSWQMPGSWLGNAEMLAEIPWIEGLELLFFSFDDEARKLFAAERDALAGLAERFSFSLHLPDPLGPADRDLVAMTESFVELYVFHPRGGGTRARGPEEWAENVESLRGTYGRERFAMEYTGEENFAKSLDILPGLPLCADTGCLIRNGRDPLEWIAARHEVIREIHLHAARGGKDHLPLGAEEAWLPGVAAAAAGSGWRIVLETFSLADTKASYQALRRAMP